MQLGSFEVVAALGEGGSAVVYDARSGDRRVALKVLRDELALSATETQRFVDEAKRMVAVDHPAVVKLLSAGVLPDGRPFLAMPFLEGETLAQRLERGPLTAGEAIDAFGVLARGVEALHAAGIVHRDVKPENILLVDTPEGARPILLDLGIARELDSGPSTTTASGRIRGTPAYMAPERFFGVPASIASDLYELALTLYVMLVGKLPWGGVESVGERLSPRGPRDFGDAVPAELARVVLRALSTRPEVRPTSALGFAEEIERTWETRNNARRAEQTTEALAPFSRRDVPFATPPSRWRRRALPMAIVLAAAAASFAYVKSRASTAAKAAAPLEASSVEAVVAPILGVEPAPAASDAPNPPPERIEPSIVKPRAKGARSSPTSRPVEPAASAPPPPPIAADPVTSDPFLEDRR